MNQMIILLIQPGERPALAEISGTLESMQKMVGGYIQVLYPFDDPIALVCNEEGKLLGLPLNTGLRDGCGRIYDTIAGTFFLCGAPPDTDHLDSLPEGLVGKYQRRFASPEVFINIGGTLLAFPYL